MSSETARRWLHRLGFSVVSSGKGVYFDGHERDDVVSDRLQYLQELKEFDQREDVVRVYHDESTYHANADEGWSWQESQSQPLRPKSLGSAIMVSDFITSDGFLRLPARQTEAHPQVMFVFL